MHGCLSVTLHISSIHTMVLHYKWSQCPKRHQKLLLFCDGYPRKWWTWVVSTVTNMVYLLRKDRNNAAKWMYFWVVNKWGHNNKPFISSVESSFFFVSCFWGSESRNASLKSTTTFQIHLRTGELCLTALTPKQAIWLAVSQKLTNQNKV